MESNGPAYITNFSVVTGLHSIFHFALMQSWLILLIYIFWRTIFQEPIGRIIKEPKHIEFTPFKNRKYTPRPGR